MALSLPGGGVYTPNYANQSATHTTPWGLSPLAAFGQINANLHTSNPDYNAIIDRLLAPLRAQLAAQQKALAAQTEFQGNLARDNSRLAQEGLTQSHVAALKSITDHLQAQGLISSGDTHYRSSQENQAFDRATAQQANQLLAYLTQLQSQLEEAARAAAAQEQGALLQAQEYAAQNYSPNTHYNPWASTTGKLIGRGLI